MVVYSSCFVQFGLVPGAGGMAVSSKPEVIRSQLADSLARLGTDYIDVGT